MSEQSGPLSQEQIDALLRQMQGQAAPSVEAEPKLESVMMATSAQGETTTSLETSASPSPGSGADTVAGLPERLRGIEVTVAVELGRIKLTIDDVLHWHIGKVMECDTHYNAPLRVLVEGRQIGDGRAVVLEDSQLGIMMESLGMKRPEHER